MDFGLALENHGEGSSPEGIAASADAAARHGWRAIWAVDHLVVAHSGAGEYGVSFEPLLSLAWIAASRPELRLATGVLVPPMRDAVQLAKELATLDVLSGGRLVVGVGVGDDEDVGEYQNLGKAERFHVRGAYLDETLALWRHLWSGAKEPFMGRFHQLTDYVFEPRPIQGDQLLIVSGGRSDQALTRVGRLTDGYYSSRWGPDDLSGRWPTMVEMARTHGRGRPYLACRVRVRFDARPDGRYSVCGTREEMLAQLLRFAEVGTDEFVAVLPAVRPADIEQLTSRFERELVQPFRDAWASRQAVSRPLGG